MPTQQQSEDGDRDQQPHVGGGHEPYGQRDEQHQGADVEDVFAGQHQRRGFDLGRQFEVGDDGSGEGHRTDEHADEHLGGVDAEHPFLGQLQGPEAVEVVFDVQVARPADQHGGQTHEAV